jgi:hypothetical protein
VYEILDGIVFTRGVALDEKSKMINVVFDLCLPLLEEGPKHTVDFAHDSAKE